MSDPLRFEDLHKYVNNYGVVMVLCADHFTAETPTDESHGVTWRDDGKTDDCPTCHIPVCKPCLSEAADEHASRLKDFIEEAGEMSEENTSLLTELLEFLELIETELG